MESGRKTGKGRFLSDRLRLAIDTALAERPADLDEFLNLMKRAGYGGQDGSGRRYQLPADRAGTGTLHPSACLHAGGRATTCKMFCPPLRAKKNAPGRSERKISLAVDIQAKLAAGKGPGYERWAKVFNIKQMAAALAYIQDNGLTDYEQLAQKATEAADRFHTISEQIKQTEQAMKTNAGLKAATVQYAKTRPVFEQYKATKYSRKSLRSMRPTLNCTGLHKRKCALCWAGRSSPKWDVLKERRP